MTWTVACFCGATFSAPPMECPRCAAALPEMAGPSRGRVAAHLASVRSLASIADSRRGLR
jgi:hypothetical protein